MFNIVRKIYDRQPASVKKNIRFLYFYILKTYKNFINFIIRKSRKIKRIYAKENFNNSYSFVILCVKNIAYVDLAIKNINSLHYFNPTHTFTIHCDDICYFYLLKKIKWLDYKDKTIILNIYKSENKPWQLFKIETLITASKNDQILIDADEIWHSDIEINFDKIIFQVCARKMKDDETESALINRLFNKNEWLEFNHYVTGFVSIPSRLMTKILANDIRNYANKIIYGELNFLNDSQQKYTIRISEELAINFAVQNNYSLNTISTLKINDPRGDKNILQSLYYGCANDIFK